MIVYFLRHASAGQSLADPKKDEKRPLDAEGTLQCRYVGRALAAADVSIEAIISSPLKRAMQTAQLVANELGFEHKIEVDNAMRPEATYAAFQSMLRKHQSKEAVMVVGHNPNMEDFLAQTIGRNGAAAGVECKKGSVAKVDMKRAGGRLQWLLTPKLASGIHSAIKMSRPKISRK
jgi:phosphohistidine phosphatase